MSTLASVLQSLQIPPDFSRYENITEHTALAFLQQWKERSNQSLKDLSALVNQDAQKPVLSLLQHADIISVAAAFNGHGPWITPTASKLQDDILSHYSNVQQLLMQDLLTRIVKPIFQSNPHPSLNLTTGRKLPRPAGGQMATQDYYDEQTWKQHPQATNLVAWCVAHMPTEYWENMWHLIIPPIMTLLDDYQVEYKIRGMQVVSDMLQRVPRSLLIRTGVNALLSSSLRTSLTFLQNPETPALLRSAIPTALSLITLTTPVGSADHFDQLCGLLGDGIIGGVWIYASNDVDALMASVDALPAVITALGIGSVRYLKALIPQLLHPLISEDARVDFQLSSVVALQTVITECAPRIHRWKGQIIEGISQCWVILADSGANDQKTKELQTGLRKTLACLVMACPSVVEDEYQRLVQLDVDMFQHLVQEDSIVRRS